MFIRIEQVVDEMLVRFDNLDLHVEHELAAVSDKLTNLLGKIEKREDKAEQRIEDLETVVKKVSSHPHRLFLIFVIVLLHCAVRQSLTAHPLPSVCCLRLILLLLLGGRGNAKLAPRRP